MAMTSLSMPMCCVSFFGEATGASESTSVAVIEANIDDLNPQVLAYAMERLLAAGALDVSLSSRS